jgi:ATP-dependent DNA ligase
MTRGEGLAVASFLEPMQCLAVTKLPEGEAWQYELKLDGFRTSAVKHAGRRRIAILR